MTKDKLEKIKKSIADGRMVARAGGISVSVEQSDKLGYDWYIYTVNDVVVRKDYAAQENPAGTADNPIVWQAGMALIQNAYYTHGGETKVWMGEAGKKAKWTDAAFVPI